MRLISTPPWYTPRPISLAPGSSDSPWIMSIVSLPASPPRKTVFAWKGMIAPGDISSTFHGVSWLSRTPRVPASLCSMMRTRLSRK